MLGRGHILLLILTENKFFELFTKKNCKKQIKNKKDIMIHLIDG